MLSGCTKVQALKKIFGTFGLAVVNEPVTINKFGGDFEIVAHSPLVDDIIFLKISLRRFRMLRQL